MKTFFKIPIYDHMKLNNYKYQIKFKFKINYSVYIFPNLIYSRTSLKIYNFL